MVACETTDAPRDAQSTEPAADGGGSSPGSSGSGGTDMDASNGSETGPQADGGTDANLDATPPCTPPATPSRVVFLNRTGGTYTSGEANSRTNSTPIVSSTTTVNAWTTTSWPALMACVSKKLEPFNITLTDVDPGTSEHLEVVFAQGSLPLFVGGTHAVAPFTCGVVANGVSFVSQGYADANIAQGCAAAVSNVGFSLGLESVTACPDAMAFDPTSCTDASFTNVALQCGTTVATSCQCGPGTTQSSFAKLLAVTGPRCVQ